MSEQEAQGAAEPQETTLNAGPSILDQAISATKRTERSRAEELMATLAEEAMKGTVTWSKNLTVTFREAIERIDAVVSKQLAAVMHTEEFLKLEGSWRGLSHLVMNSETGSGLKIRMLNLKKREAFKDLSKAVEFDQSEIWKKLYENEFGTPGGEPYGTLIGDFEFSNHPDDIELLSGMSNIAAGAFCPFITAPSASFFGFDSWEELSKPRDLEKIFESPEYTKWRSFRESEDSRFVTMTMPRALGRLPYGTKTKPVEEFDFEEIDDSLEHNEYCWMNAAYVMGTTMTKAFSENGWCTAIRGAEGGGKVEGLPTHNFLSDAGDVTSKCPTEIGITDRREAELSNCGMLPLCHYKNTDYAVFFGAQTTQKPKKYDQPEATANAAISSRLPYLLSTSRFAHYLKVMARDKVGSFAQASDCEIWLNKWIQSYVNGNAGSGQDMKAKYPLAEAKIEVVEIPGAPGSYNAVAHLRPWLQMEELTTSMRLVAKIPQKG